MAHTPAHNPKIFAREAIYTAHTPAHNLILHQGGLSTATPGSRKRSAAFGTIGAYPAHIQIWGFAGLGAQPPDLAGSGSVFLAPLFLGPERERERDGERGRERDREIET